MTLTIAKKRNITIKKLIIETPTFGKRKNKYGQNISMLFCGVSSDVSIKVKHIAKVIAITFFFLKLLQLLLKHFFCIYATSGRNEI